MSVIEKPQQSFGKQQNKYGNVNTITLNPSYFFAGELLRL